MGDCMDGEDGEGGDQLGLQNGRIDCCQCHDPWDMLNLHYCWNRTSWELSLSLIRLEE